jgi:N-acetylglucosamine-6-phosphate deacetylase
VRIRARDYRSGQPIDLDCQQGRIHSLEPAGTEPADIEAGWVAPALFDLQINGCHGISFNSSQITVEDAGCVVHTCRAHGILGFFPTLITNSFEALRHGCETLVKACEISPVVARTVLGIHLEGPYISSENGPRGAHPLEHVRPPDWEEFRRLQDAARGMIGLLTLAPEREGALPFIERATAAGVVIALGHTGASPALIRDAIRAGARLSTHLGNGSHPLLPRHENYFWEQLAADNLWASVIADGRHLPSALLRCILRVKSPRRTILTCDASSLAGLPPGRYAEWGQELDVMPDGSVVLAGTEFLAGAGVFTDSCVRHALQMLDLSLAEVLDMAGANPRRLLGLPEHLLEPGGPADLLLFEHEPTVPFQLSAVIAAGEIENLGHQRGA